MILKKKKLGITFMSNNFEAQKINYIFYFLILSILPLHHYALVFSLIFFAGFSICDLSE